MSSGHGLVVQRLLEEAGPGWIPVRELAAAIEGREGRSRTERSAVVSTRRAAKRLVAEGLLELDYIQPDGSRWSDEIAERGYSPDAWPSHPHWQLAVRRLSTTS